MTVAGPVGDLRGPSFSGRARCKGVAQLTRFALPLILSRQSVLQKMRCMRPMAKVGAAVKLFLSALVRYGILCLSMTLWLKAFHSISAPLVDTLGVRRAWLAMSSMIFVFTAVFHLSASAWIEAAENRKRGVKGQSVWLDALKEFVRPRTLLVVSHSWLLYVLIPPLLSSFTSPVPSGWALYTQMLCFLIVAELVVYAVHGLMHTPMSRNPVIKYIQDAHRVHHVNDGVALTYISHANVSLAEMFCLGYPTYLAAPLLFRAHPAVTLYWNFIVSVGAALSHTDYNVDFAFHRLHHQHPRCNLGALGMMDAFFGTLRLHGEEPSGQPLLSRASQRSG